MTKFMEKHRFLFRLFLLVTICVLVYGSLFIVHKVQVAMRMSTLSGQPIYATDNGIKEYDVTGMTDEEIQQMLEQNRNKSEE